MIKFLQDYAFRYICFTGFFETGFRVKNTGLRTAEKSEIRGLIFQN